MFPSMESSVPVVFLEVFGRKVAIYLGWLGDAYGLSSPYRHRISLSNELTEDTALDVLCHEIAHIMYNMTRDSEGSVMTSEDFATLSEEWARIIPQLRKLTFEFSTYDGGLVRLYERV